MQCPLTISDIIEIIGIITSLITSIVAIVISIATLRQNSKMIESTSRPYIGIYSAGNYVKKPNSYIILKNFGQSSATILSFSCDIDLAKLNPTEFDYKPFQNIQGTVIMPGQSFHACIDLNNVYPEITELNFNIIYASDTHTYSENIHVNLAANIGNFILHNTSKNQELAIISETLQDMHIHSL